MDAPPPVRGAVKSGVFWIIGAFGIMQLIRFGSNVVMTHLLEPQAFGLLALTFALIVGLHLFSEIGIRVSIIQNPRGDDRDFLDTAWTIQVVRGFMIWFASIALAWPVAFWRPQPEPKLLWILPAIGFMAVLEGFITTKLHSLYRHLHQRQAVLLESTASATGTAVMLTWASLAPPENRLFALVAGPLTTSFMLLILSYMLPGPRNRFRRDPESIKQLIHFGRWIFLSTICTFLADQSDSIVVSYFSIAALGVYHLAKQIATIPSNLMGTLARQITMPLYSRLLEAGENATIALHRVQAHTGAATALLVGGLIAIGPTLVRCLYDERYRDAMWMLPMLAVAFMIQIFDTTAASLLLAGGKSRVYALSNVVKVACLALFMPLGAWSDGIRGLIVAVILGETGRYLCTGIALRRNGFTIFRRDIAWGMLAVVLGLSVHHLVLEFRPPLPVGQRRLGIPAGPHDIGRRSRDTQLGGSRADRLETRMVSTSSHRTAC